MAYDEMSWAAPFSLQTQLKRAADLVLASGLLLVTSPLLLLAMAWWLGRPRPSVLPACIWLDGIVHGVEID